MTPVPAQVSLDLNEDTAILVNVRILGTIANSFLFLIAMHLLLYTSKALVPSSDALVPSSFLKGNAFLESRATSRPFGKFDVS